MSRVLRRTYKQRWYHRWENVLVGTREDVACGGYIFRRTGLTVTAMAITIHPVETRRVMWHVSSLR
jgi:hypothetical protein